MAVKLEQKLE